MFSGINPKGETLLSFLQTIGHIPKKIIFIDDNIDHIKSVEITVKQMHTKFIGFHYIAPQIWISEFEYIL